MTALLLPLIFLSLMPMTAQFASFAADIPNWYLHLQANDDLTLYGAGEGATQDEAKHVALKNISESISVAIDSKVEKNERINRTIDGTSYSKTVKNKISAETKKINFRNYNIIRSEIVGGKFFILIAVDKDAFIKEQKTDLSDLLKDADSVFQLALSKSIFEKWEDLKSINANREKVLAQVAIISSLDDTFDRTASVEKVNHFQNAFRQLRDDISVYLSLDTESAFLGPVIANYLTDAGIKLAARQDRNDKNLATLSLSSNVKRLKIYNNYIANVRTDLMIYSNNGSLISNKTVEAKGVSAIDFESAVKAAGNKIGEIIIKEGISKIIEIN